MKSLKKLMVAILTVAVLCTGVVGTAFAATSSPHAVAVKSAKIKGKSTVKYSGKTKKVSLTVKGPKNETLKLGKDYVIVSPDSLKFKHSGTYTIKIKGINHYKGTKKVKFKIKGTASASQNKITTKVSKSAVRASSLKKKSTKITVSVKKAKSFKGKVTYKVISTPKKASKYITVSSKGVVTLKKGAKKGTYKVKVYVAGYRKYNPKTKTIAIKVK